MLIHSHPHEKARIVLIEEVEFTSGIETCILKSGQSHFIPANAPNELKFMGWASGLGIFSPSREDYSLG